MKREAINILETMQNERNNNKNNFIDFSMKF